MQFRTIIRLLGILLMMFSCSMLTPLVINLLFHEHLAAPFIQAFLYTFVLGFVCWLSCKGQVHELKTRDGFLIVFLFWAVLCLAASIPLQLVVETGNSFTDAIFESVSGFTTTGASVITHLDKLPHTILFYRQQLQFLGGMGIVVLAVAIMPMLGVGGMQLYRAETPGPMKDSKLTPRIAQTAKMLWSLYVFLTLLCTLCYMLAGMDWFSALCESFATVSTGGFSIHDQSFAFYNSESIELICVVFMLLGATNFGLHFIALRKMSLRYYWADEEFRSYMIFLLLAVLTIGLSLVAYHYFTLTRTHHALLTSLFNVISMATTTGFTSAPFSQWPEYVTILITLMAIIGGCAGSTSGGVKVIRSLLLFKQSKREMRRLLHPNAIIPIKFGQSVLAESVLQSMWGFLSVFIALFLALMVVLIGLGNDFLTSFSAMTASLANAGAGIGGISSTFAHLNTPSKWVLIFAMLAGRLEIFSILILFSRHFWQRY